MTPFSNDWPKSFFASQDPVAIDSVALDFFRTEDSTIIDNADDYLREAALANNPPSGTLYEPAGLPVEQSLGVHEVWNNSTDKQYTGNLGLGNGIDLVSTPPSALSVLPVSIPRGQTGTVQIQLNAQGTECALGFSLNFDPTVLSFNSAQLVGTAQNAALSTNTSRLAGGHIGIALMMNPTAGQPLGTFPSGISPIVALSFTAIDQGTNTVTTSITFGDTPVVCDVVDANANELPATYDAGNVTVQPPLAAPTANNLSFATQENTPLAITLTGFDPNGYTLTYNLVTQTSNGSLSGTGVNLTYTPNPGYYGSDSFYFTVNDGVYTSPPALVTITVARVYVPPVAFNQNLSMNENANVTTSLLITLSGSNQDGIAATAMNYTIVNPPSNGTLTQPAPTASPANYQYIPNVGFVGQDSFTFTASFSVNNHTYTSVPATISISVLPVYLPPVASNQTVTIPHGIPASITLQGYDPNSIGNALTYNIVSWPIYGTLNAGNLPSAVYTPPSLSFSGQDSFTFTVTDQHQLTSSPATVTIIVTPSDLQSVNLTSTPVSPVTVNTPVTLAALPAGTTNVQYQFLLNNGVIQPYSTVCDLPLDSDATWNLPV